MISIQCIQNLSNKDKRAQKEVFEYYGGRFIALISRYINDREKAKDLMVDGMLKVFKNVSKSSFENASFFEAWMTKIFINEALQHLRRATNYRMIVAKNWQEETVSNKGIETLNEEAILKYISELPNGCRTIFNLYAIEGYNHKEIADQLGISTGTSKSQLNHARKLLKEKIKTYERI